MTEDNKETATMVEGPIAGGEGRDERGTIDGIGAAVENERQGTASESINNIPPLHHPDLLLPGSSAAVSSTAVTTRSASFAALKQNWETLINHGTRGLQNLSLCGTGEELARITGVGGAEMTGEAGQIADDDGDDPFASIVLRHTHSLPIEYSHSLMDDEDTAGDPGPPVGLDMRRSSSTPSAFRERSANSAFGTQLRAMPHLGDDYSDSSSIRRSAFTLPMHRSTYSSSDSSIRYSAAFDPFYDDVEATSIEVTDMGSNRRRMMNSVAAANETAATRARRFMSHNLRGIRRRRRFSGRENPVQPLSTGSVSSSSEESKTKRDDDTISTKSSTPNNSGKASNGDSSGRSVRHGMMNRLSKSKTGKQNASSKGGEVPGSSKGTKKSTYQNLDSDVDEELQHNKRLETEDSPHTIPSPSYERFVDEHRPNSRTESSDVVGKEDATNVVRIEVSSSSASKSVPVPPPPPPAAVSPHRDIVVDNTRDRVVTTPSPQGSSSPATSRISQSTSGHTTLASLTSSSGGRTQLSTVSETDREVMETNKAGKLARKLSLHATRRGEAGGELISLHSTSTSSTNTNGYLALANSPVPQRDGATVPMERFFSNGKISVAHSSSSSTSSDSRTLPRGKLDAGVELLSNASDPSKRSIVSPVTVKSDSTAEEPPKFVSYNMERQMTEQSKGVSTVSSQRTPDSSDRDSPAQIVPLGYSEVIFEEAKPQGSKLIRPLQSRSKKFMNRPPLSPAKGLRNPPPTTPPPTSGSPAYQQLSPPNIVDQVDHVDHHLDLSKPYVLRGQPRKMGEAKKMVLLSPPSASARRGMTLDVIPDDESMTSSYYNGGNGTSDTIVVTTVNRRRTYHESSIEVNKDRQRMLSAPPAVVTPDKRLDNICL